MDTGFAGRALAGEAPHLPEPADARAVARQVVDAMREDRAALAYDLRRRVLVAR